MMRVFPRQLVLLLLLAIATHFIATARASTVRTGSVRRRSYVDHPRCKDVIRIGSPINVHGFITQWTVYVDTTLLPPNRFPFRISQPLSAVRRFPSIELRVYRPLTREETALMDGAPGDPPVQESTGNRRRAYRLVGSNTMHPSQFMQHGQLFLRVDPEEQIRVRPGDVLGWSHIIDDARLSEGDHVYRDEIQQEGSAVGEDDSNYLSEVMTTRPVITFSRGSAAGEEDRDLVAVHCAVSNSIRGLAGGHEPQPLSLGDVVMVDMDPLRFAVAHESPRVFRALEPRRYSVAAEIALLPRNAMFPRANRARNNANARSDGIRNTEHTSAIVDAQVALPGDLGTSEDNDLVNNDVRPSVVHDEQSRDGHARGRPQSAYDRVDAAFRTGIHIPSMLWTEDDDAVDQDVASSGHIGGDEVEPVHDPCAICLLSMSRGATTSTGGCSHRFHRACLQRWSLALLPNSQHCPVCREPMAVMLHH